MTLAEKLRFLADRAEDGKDFLVGDVLYAFIDGELLRYFNGEWTLSTIYFNTVLNRDITNQKKQWSFTDDEKAILRNLDEIYQWIARDKNGRLWVYGEKPEKKENIFGAPFGSCNHDLPLYKHIFKNVKWEDEEPCEFRRYI